MALPSFVMANKRFNYLILAAFILGTSLLIFVLYNASQNTSKLIKGNANLLRELQLSDHLREIDRDILGVEGRIRAAIATNDTSHLEGIDSKIQTVKSYLDSINIHNTDPKVKQYIDRLNVLAVDKVKVKNILMGRFLATGKMNDTSFIANPRARLISNEIMKVTGQIYNSRQNLMIRLSTNIQENVQKTMLYRNILITVLLLSGAILCLFIINQFRLQNQLIVKLDVSEKKAQEAAQIKENFLANMSHEIRTPLSAILGFTNLLKRQQLNPESDEFVGSIQSAGENLMMVVNDILDLSKIEAGMMRIVHAPFSVSGLLHSIETLFNERIREKGLQFHSKIAADVPDTLIGDATRLTQILVNLIGNALKFSERGEIRVDVYNQMTKAGKIQLGFRITDTGIGIDKQKLTAIFERFNQAEDSITRNYGGTGLGLSIVRNLILLQDGNIEVNSEPGKGTEFNFYIPYTIADEQISNESYAEANLYKDKINTSLSILVVDDNAMNQSLMKHLLTQWNATFDIAGNGNDAIAKLKTKQYDLVLMDIQMPGMDGYTATNYIRTTLKSNIPIIAMTAHAMAGEREKCMSHGMNEYISKPINEHDLLKLINKFIPPKPAQENNPAVTPQTGNYEFIDLSYMKEISKGNINYERTVTSQFLECIPDDLSALQTAFDTKNYQEVSRIAHNMKTSVAIMGLLPRLTQILDALELASTLNTNIDPLITELESVCAAAIHEANHFYKTLQ
ncbi:hybrid sensor histidine kinase/response regulator [Mucilaginibacter aquaedulcis]|uniref:hybrid sensor histidine kinase/response regulator n=1 Tax=Mucilaginibacter aquaedulcis TaxID=1187081 RepID=UPI0025B44565|nr:hybrid sensor histidine kinase/response regulator [Mucilaginibacter aquaedulcis]MDN3550678.1 response regulator [Mucilaginibacter aquaedulcis]